jgi:hypothetical protein
MGSLLWILIPVNRFIIFVFHPDGMSEYFIAFLLLFLVYGSQLCHSDCINLHYKQEGQGVL